MWAGCEHNRSPNLDTLLVREALDTIVWEGEPTSASFIVDVPADASPRGYAGKASVANQGVTFAKIPFVVSVTDSHVGEYAANSTRVKSVTSVVARGCRNRRSVPAHNPCCRRVASRAKTGENRA